MSKIKFKLECHGTTRPKEWLPKACKTLPSPFTLDDVKPSMFNKSIIKRLQTISKDGAKIKVRGGRGYYIGIVVINKDDRAKQNTDITNLKRRHTNLLKHEVLKEFIKVRAQLWNKTYDEAYDRIV